ncbi:hypothetical protein RQP46_002849 [Phenoliferia psychrophenolica]
MTGTNNDNSTTSSKSAAEQANDLSLSGGARSSVGIVEVLPQAIQSRLRTFLAQLRLVYRANPNKFATDTSKVTYACSYLDGIAFSWYENYISKDIEPDWFSDFPHFERELESNFGTINSTAVAERKVQRILMRTSDHLSDYLTKFNSLRNDLDWNESAINFAFKRGLPNRIKDEISRSDTVPRSFQELTDLCLRIDFQYWDRESERHTEERGPSSAPQGRMRDPPTPNTHVKVNTFSPMDRNISLDKEGKIPREERERRFKEHLCLYCGEKHFLIDCTRRPAHNSTNPDKTQVRVAQDASERRAITNVKVALPTQTEVYAARSRNPLPPTRTNDWGVRGGLTRIGMAQPPPYENHQRTWEEKVPRERRNDMLVIPIRLTLAKRTYSAMIDSGSYHSHLDINLAHRLGLPTKALPRPVTILGFNGKPAGTSLYTLPWDFGIGEHHFRAEGMEWLVSPVKGEQKIILGYDFLKTFNPIIDWEEGLVEFRNERSTIPDFPRNAYGLLDLTGGFFPLKVDLEDTTNDPANDLEEAIGTTPTTVCQAAYVPPIYTNHWGISGNPDFYYGTVADKGTLPEDSWREHQGPQPGIIPYTGKTSQNSDHGHPTLTTGLWEELLELPDDTDEKAGSRDVEDSFPLPVLSRTESIFPPTHEPSDLPALPDLWRRLEHDHPVIHGLPAAYRLFGSVFRDAESIPPYPETLQPPAHRDHDMRILLSHNRRGANAAPRRSHSAEELFIIRDYLDEMEGRGLIYPVIGRDTESKVYAVTIDRCTTILFDFWAINAKIVRPFATSATHPSLGTKLLGTASGVVFTKIRIREPGYQLRIREGDEAHTRFRAPNGAEYEWRVIPKGMANASFFWNTFVREILPPDAFPFVVAYADDIIIHSGTKAEHEQQVIAVLSVLANHNLHSDLTFCEFSQEGTTLGNVPVGKRS